MKAYVHHLMRDTNTGDILGVSPVAKIDYPNIKDASDSLRVAESAFEATQNIHGSWSLKLGEDANPNLDVLADLPCVERKGEHVLMGIRSSMGHDVIAIDTEDGSDSLIWYKVGVFSSFEPLSDDLMNKYQLTKSVTKSGLSTLESSDLALLANLSSLMGIACIEHEKKVDKAYLSIEDNPIHQALDRYLREKSDTIKQAFPKAHATHQLLGFCQTNYELLRQSRHLSDDALLHFAKPFASMIGILAHRSGIPYPEVSRSRFLDKDSPESRLIESSPLLGKLYDQGCGRIFLNSLQSPDPLAQGNQTQSNKTLER